MSPFNLRIDHLSSPENIEGIAPCFSWDADESLKQFTIELSPLPDFSLISFLRDTRNHYYRYDGKVLPTGKYFWRVRSGLKEWAVQEFTVK